MIAVSSGIPITFATLITLIRFILVPPLVVALQQHAWDHALIIMAIAGISDLMDGWCARFFNQQTQLGACLDPLADKVLMISCYITMFSEWFSALTIPAWFVTFVIVREVSIILGTLLISMYVNKPYGIKPTFLGKAAMALQVIFVLSFFIAESLHLVNNGLILWIFYGVVSILALSWAQYMYCGIREL